MEKDLWDEEDRWNKQANANTKDIKWKVYMEGEDWGGKKR